MISKLYLMIKRKVNIKLYKEEALKKCNTKIDGKKSDIEYCTDKDHLKFLKEELDFYKTVKTALEYFYDC